MDELFPDDPRGSAAPPIPDLPGRLLLPELAAAELGLDLVQLAKPSPRAELAEFRAWSDLCHAARVRLQGVQARFAPLLCHFCFGHSTSGNKPCSMCEASGLSPQGQQVFRFHHDGE